MAYNTPYKPYTGYLEINQCLKESGLDVLIEIQEYELELFYTLYLDGEVMIRESCLDDLLRKICIEFGRVFMRKHFLKSKLDQHGVKIEKQT